MANSISPVLPVKMILFPDLWEQMPCICANKDIIKSAISCEKEADFQYYLGNKWYFLCNFFT